VLFDSWKKAYADEFVEAVEKLVDPRDIDYIVVHHVEQDHSGAIPCILEANGGRAEVLGHRLAGMLLRSFHGVSSRFRALDDGERIALGDRELVFIHTPWLHWPDTIMTFIPGDDALLSGDAFGGFSTPSAVTDEGDVSGYLRHVRKYVVDIVGRYGDYVLKVVEKIRQRGLAPKIIAPAHGLVFKRNPGLIVDYYVKLAKGIPEKDKVTVVYGSMYGSVEKAIYAVAEELRRHGAKPVIYGFTDSEWPEIGDVLSDIADSAAVVFGAATYEAGVFPPMKHLLDMVAQKIRTGKPVLVISSYGWGGIAGKKMSERLSEAGFRVVDKVEFHGQPTSDVLDRIRDAVKALVEEAGL